MVCPEHHVDRAFTRQQPLQFQYAFARHDDLLLVQTRPVQLRLAQRQPVPVGGHRADVLTARFQQHPIQVVPHVLLGHRKMRLVDQPAQHLLAHRYRLARLDVLDTRKLRCGQRRERELGPPRAHVQFLTAHTHRDVRAFRQGSADIQQLATRYRYFPTRLDVYAGLSNQLYLEIRGRHRQLAVLRDEQYVRQNGHCLTPLYDPDHGLQRLQQHVPACAQLHRFHLLIIIGNY